MPDDAPFDPDPRLGRIVSLLGADAVDFDSGEPSAHDRLAEMLRLWSRLTRREDHEAALAYLRTLADEAGLCTDEPAT